MPFLILGLSNASAQPLGGSVAAGQAQISSSGATTVINQSSQKAIINWQDFSVGQGAAVQFNQPNSSAITLNRVTGSSMSTIDGAIRANGQVWLLNPNGMLLGNNATIHVGGLLATTADIANQDFLQGRYNFSGGQGAIVNSGTIQAGHGGSVVLSAPSVTNRGLIRANAGHVVLGGTDTFTVDFNGDHLLSYAVGANSAGGHVSNSGKISAPGGQVLLTARAASGVQDAVINNTGMIEATSAHAENGEIILEADNGAVSSSGTLDASGKGAGESGGTVKVLGKEVAIADGATIDVSGDAGGGTALIGGNFRGAGSEAHAQNTTVGKAVINANAIRRGDGGKVAVWSDGRTDFSGSINAAGGASGGNGGQVETSGHDLNIPAAAMVNTAAINGTPGAWLLDPHNITISSLGSDPVTGQTFINAPPANVVIDPAAIGTALQTGNVTLQANNDILFANNLTVTGGAGNSLTLQAGRNIALGAFSISYLSGNVLMTANNTAGTSAAYRDSGAAFISTTGGTIGAARLDLMLISEGRNGSLIGSAAHPLIVVASTPTYIRTLGANAYVTTGAGNNAPFVIGNTANAGIGADVATGNLFLTAAGVTQLGSINAAGFSLNLPSGISSGNPVVLDNTGNTVANLNIAAMGRNIDGSSYVTFVNAGDLTVGTISTTPNLTGNTGPRGPAVLQSMTGQLTLTGNIDVSGLTLKAGRDVQQTGGNITSSLVTNMTQPGSNGITVQAGGDISLTSANNTIAQAIANTGLGSQTAVSVPGQLQLTAAGSATVNMASNIRLLNSSLGGTLTLTTTGSYTLLNSAGGAVLNNNGIQIYGPLNAAGLISLNAAGDITQATNLTSDVHITTAAGLSAVSSGTIVLDDSGPAGRPADTGNAISGSVRLVASGALTFYNTVKTVIGGAASGGAATIKVFDTAGHSGHNDLVLKGAVTAGGVLTLSATGNIINYKNQSILNGPGISLLSSFGTIGASDGVSPSPFALSLTRTSSAIAVQALAPNGDINLSAPFSISIGLSAGSGPGIQGNSVSLVSGGSITQNGAGAAYGLIKAQNLFVSGSKITLDNVAVASLSARSQTGDIDITTSTGFMISNTGGLPGIQTGGAVFLTGSNGTFTQTTGVSGAIIAGSLSVSDTGRVILDNGANAITGSIAIGSMGDATLVNSLTTHLAVGLVGGTLTVQSAGDLELVAGPSIAALSSGQNLTINKTSILSASFLANINGTILSFRNGGDGVVLAAQGSFINNAGATALVLSSGARFLIYSADPAQDVFGGMTTANAAIFSTNYPTPIAAAGNRYVFGVPGSTNTSYLTVVTPPVVIPPIVIPPVVTPPITTPVVSVPAAPDPIPPLVPEPPPPPIVINYGLTAGTSTAAAPALVGFVTALQPPSQSSPPPILIDKATSTAPSAPPPSSPLAEPPSAADGATSHIANSLEGGAGGASIVIPHFLSTAAPPPPGTLDDTSVLSGFGNMSLWQ